MFGIEESSSLIEEGPVFVRSVAEDEDCPGIVPVLRDEAGPINRRDLVDWIDAIVI